LANSISRQDRSESRKLYGRKKGRPLGSERAEAIEKLLPALSVAIEKLSERHDVHPASLFTKLYKQYWLEIGFGQGEHVSALMRENPDTGYLAAEPFINGVASFVKGIKDMCEHNVRILHDDGMKIACSLNPASIDGIYILNPDPWPKKRHHERRIVNQEKLHALAKILKSGAPMILSTDVPDLADWMMTQTVNHGAFTWEANSAKDWWERPSGWHPTRYELKRANHSERMCYLLFKRN
jgi:tRNA (guanine-N7-)-methyltransferase